MVTPMRARTVRLPNGDPPPRHRTAGSDTAVTSRPPGCPPGSIATGESEACKEVAPAASLVAGRQWSCSTARLQAPAATARLVGGRRGSGNPAFNPFPVRPSPMPLLLIQPDPWALVDAGEWRGPARTGRPIPIQRRSMIGLRSPKRIKLSCQQLPQAVNSSLSHTDSGCSDPAACDS